MEHTTTIGVGEEITLELDTDITTTRRALTSTVTESREFVDHVSITTPALCDGVRGVLKGERTLELTSADLELWESSPFCIEVNELNGGLTRTSGVGTLNLGAPVEVTDLTVEDETGQTQVEGVRVVAFRILSLILQHSVTAKLNVLHPLGKFDSLLLLLLLGVLYLLLLSRNSAGETDHQRH